MSKSIRGKLQDAKKSVERLGKTDLNVKQVQAALADAEKAAAEVGALKNKLTEAITRRERSIAALDQALRRVTLEKKLKAKEARVKAKLAALDGTPGAS